MHDTPRAILVPNQSICGKSGSPMKPNTGKRDASMRRDPAGHGGSELPHLDEEYVLSMLPVLFIPGIDPKRLVPVRSEEGPSSVWRHVRARGVPEGNPQWVQVARHDAAMLGKSPDRSASALS